MTDKINPKRQTNQLREYMGESEINLSHLKTMSGEEIGVVVTGWDRDRWRREVESKSTLQLYRNKIGMWDEEIYSTAMVLDQLSFSNVEQILLG